MSKFQKIYKKLFKQQKEILKKTIIKESKEGYFREVCNFFNGAKETISNLSDAQFKKAYKSYLKCISSPVNAIAELRNISTSELKEEYIKIQEIAFEANPFLKKALDKITEEFPDDIIIDEFIKVTKDGKEFVEVLKEKLKDDEKVKSVLRKILALRKIKISISVCLKDSNQQE